MARLVSVITFSVVVIAVCTGQQMLVRSWDYLPRQLDTSGSGDGNWTQESSNNMSGTTNTTTNATTTTARATTTAKLYPNTTSGKPSTISGASNGSSGTTKTTTLSYATSKTTMTTLMANSTATTERTTPGCLSRGERCTSSRQCCSRWCKPVLNLCW